MALFTSVHQIPKLQQAVVTIGSFDGVHLGHQTILKHVVDTAKRIDGESVLVTFEPHPRKFLNPNDPIQLITPLQEKLPLLQTCGIDHILVAEFNEEFSNLSGEAYIEDFLCKFLKPHTIIVGYDHRYGKNRASGLELLQERSQALNYEVEEISALLINDAAISSTQIRKALQCGNVAKANDMLGRKFSIKGTVIHGAQLGRTIGFPTANLRLLNKDQMLPCYGVYMVEVLIDNELFEGMMNIGNRPTVNATNSVHLEVNIHDFNRDIYGKHVEVRFVDFIREEKKFNQIDDLVQQIKADEALSRNRRSTRN